MKKILLFAVLSSLWLSCGRMADRPEQGAPAVDGQNSVSTAAAPTADKSVSGDEMSVKAATVTPSAAGEKIPAKIIRNATVRYQVDDYRKSRPAIQKIVEAAGAYISSERESNNGYTLENILTIRVEGRNFDKLMEDLLTQSAYLNEKNVTASDVTEEFVDLEARLRTKVDVEQRYREILRQAGTIPDILAVERELRTVQEEIESAKGRLRYLQDQVSYSTITLTVYQKLDHEPEPGPGFFADLLQAVRGGWQLVLNIFLGLIYIWPILLLVAGFVWLLRRYRRRKKAARIAPPA